MYRSPADPGNVVMLVTKSPLLVNDGYGATAYTFSSVSWTSQGYVPEVPEDEGAPASEPNPIDVWFD